MQVKVQAINDTFHHKLSNYSKYSATTGPVLHICKQLYFGFRKVFQARPLYFVYEVLKPTQRSGDSRRKFFFPRLPSPYPSTLLKGVIVLLRNVLFQILGRSLKQFFIFYLKLQEFVQIWVSFDNYIRAISVIQRFLDSATRTHFVPFPQYLEFILHL